MYRSMTSQVAAISAGDRFVCWKGNLMARTDAIVLGAGIVGTSIALHLAKRGLAVALRRPPRAGRGDLLRQCRRDRGQYDLSASRFRPSLAALLRVALKQATEANYHLVVPAAGRALAAGLPRPSRPERRIETAARHAAAVRARGRRARGADGGGRRRALSAQERLAQALSQRGGLRGTRASASSRRSSGIADPRARPRRDARARAGARAGLPPRRALARRGEHHQSARADAGLCGALCALGGVVLTGDARSLHRAERGWRVETDGGPLDAARGGGRARAVGAGPARAARHPSCRSRSSAAITGISARAAMPA